MDKQLPQHPLLVILWLLSWIEALQQRIKDLEARLNEDSSTSNQPPSGDSPYERPARKSQTPSNKKRGGQPGHQGQRQQLLEPTEERHVQPQKCRCGCTDLEDQGAYYRHQEVELPEIQLTVRHFLLHRGRCTKCGKEAKAKVPSGHDTGYGPRLSGLIALLSGDHGDSRETVQRFCRQFLDLHISQGAIQKVINRVSEAIKPHYEAIREQVYQSQINHLDESPWYQAGGVLQWLWVMGNSAAAFFMVHTKRNKKAFKDLIDKWEGILVSDNYGVYRNWVNLQQSCLSHLIRRAKGLAEHKNPEIAKCGAWARDELRRLVAMANAPPTKGQWRAFYARFCRLLSRYRDRKDQAGTYVRTLEKLMANLWVFLQVEGVEPTNNLAERLLRRAVIWRKRSMGTESESGDRWVERILTLTQTCRLQNRLCYPVLVGAMESQQQGRDPDLIWISKIYEKDRVEATP